MKAIFDTALRVALTSLHAGLRFLWFIWRPNTSGAHALAITPGRKIILVKLRYAPGWRLPGGGRRESEAPVDAALRELGEEIGMVSHGKVTVAGEVEQRVYSKRDTASLVVVHEVSYRPRWSWEVEAICEADPRDLPADTSASSRNWIEKLRPLI